MARHAGLLIRVFAWLLDAILLLLPAFLLERMIMGADALSALQFLPSISAAFISIYTEGRGATPGKILLGLRVLDERGRTIGTSGALLRHVCKILCYLSLGAGFLMIALDKEKRGLHDMIAKTHVARKA